MARASGTPAICSRAGWTPACRLAVTCGVMRRNAARGPCPAAGRRAHSVQRRAIRTAELACLLRAGLDSGARSWRLNSNHYGAAGRNKAEAPRSTERAGHGLAARLDVRPPCSSPAPPLTVLHPGMPRCRGGAPAASPEGLTPLLPTGTTDRPDLQTDHGSRRVHATRCGAHQAPGVRQRRGQLGTERA